MKSPKDILNIVQSRLAETTILLDKGYFESACYLAGHSVELALKAKICVILDIPNLFDDESLLKELNSFKTHDINRLLLLSGIRKKLEKEMSNNVTLYENWNLILKNWNEDCRYLCCGTKSEQEALDLIKAIGNAQDGILSWILKN